MNTLNEKLLLEEDGFEDVETETTEESPDATEIPHESTEDGEVGNDPSEEENPPVDEPVVADVASESTTTLYKVSFTLGKHHNWSRIDATSKEEAEQLVIDYVTRKWPDRAFEVVEVEEFDESEMEEQLGSKTLSESTTMASPIETGAAVGMAGVISDLIKDEYEAIDGYNSAIATAEAEGYGDMVAVLTEIQAEENLHIGQLQTLMNMVDPNAHLIEDGKAEGEEQLANPLGGSDTFDESLKENLDDMSLEDQRMFIRCVNEIWHMSVMDWTQKYYDGKLEVVTVNSYDDIPDASNLIEIGSSDISQGTGNVIIYTYMDAGDGTLYRYASF